MGLWQADCLHDCAHCIANGLQSQRGCPDLSKNHGHIFYEVAGTVYQHCLVRDVTPQSIAWLQEYNFMEAGFMPESGGLNDQFEIDLQAFNVIAAEKAALKEKDGNHG